MRQQPITQGSNMLMEDIFGLDALGAMEVFPFDEVYDWDEPENEFEVQYDLINNYGQNDLGTDEDG